MSTELGLQMSHFELDRTLFGLMASGMIRMRRIQGHADMGRALEVPEVRSEGQTEVRQLVTA